MMSDANAPLNMSVSGLIDRHPESIRVFMQFRMACVGCDIAAFETVAEALKIYRVDPDEFARELDRAILQKEAGDPAGTGVIMSSGSDLQFKQSLDVRVIPPAQRHLLIFETFEALRGGEALELVNDHDPKPLYYQFAAERAGQFTWDYIEQGPQVWRVRIGKPTT